MQNFTEIQEFLQEHKFTTFIDVKFRHSISDCIPKKDVCGIYVLQFSDGEYYVGQSVDVTKRFLQHRKNHNDIIGVFFRKTPKKELDAVEQQMIAEMEVRCQLRNISYASMPKLLNSDLDILIPNEKQDAWLKNDEIIIENFERVDDEALRERYEKKAELILSDHYFRKYHLPVVKKYVSKCIIEPYLTELTYWGCSCLPYTSIPKFQKGNTEVLYARMNLRWQEVFGCFGIKDNIAHTWQVAMHPFDENFSQLEKYSDVYVNLDLWYPSGGEDQVRIISENFDSSMALLDDPIFLKAAKIFNLERMRTGAQPYANYHSLTLADAILKGLK